MRLDFDMVQPLVSVILPAFRAEATLPQALASIREAGLPEHRVEAIVASDDGRDYAPLLPDLPFLRLTPAGPVQSGAGAARNRALAQARGEIIAFLDADDSWAPGYLAELVPLARRHGAAFARTRVFDGARCLCTLPAHDGPLALEDLGHTGASFHPVLDRRQSRIFTDHLSQDVRHAAELLARVGGAAPLGEAFYELRLNRTSTTAGVHFAARVARAYESHVSEVLAGKGDIPAGLRPRVAQVFRDKAALNAAFAQQAATGQGFYEFVAARLARQTGGQATPQISRQTAL